MATIGPNYDPASTAQALAESFTAARQQMLTSQNAQASATTKALSTLSSVLSAFQNSLASLAGLNKTIAASSALFSDTTVASATALSTAAAGSYSFFVEQLASAHQVSYRGLQDFTGGGSLTIGVGSANPPFEVVLDKPSYTVRELAAAINGAANNTTVSASVVTTGTDANGKSISELVLTSRLTGEANTISLTANGGVDTTLAAGLHADVQHESSKALDAVVYLGSKDGTQIKQATNTLNVIDGVTMTLTKAQATGSAPVTLTVGTDTSKTTANVQAFVDAYNTLKSAVDAMVRPGDPASGGTPGVFAGDSGVRALRDRLVSLVRNTGTTSLANYGIIANRQGTLNVDSARLSKTLAANPTGLDSLIGTAANSAPSGIAGQLHTYLKGWTDTANGQIGSRKEAVNKLMNSLTDRQALLDRQYDSAYARYLTQFTQLQAVQNSMSYNTSLFDAMFSSDKD